VVIQERDSGNQDSRGWGLDTGFTQTAKISPPLYPLPPGEGKYDLFTVISRLRQQLPRQERRPQMKKGNQNRHDGHFLVAFQG